MRMEEASKYRHKLSEQRNELEQLHQDKIKELKLREQEALDRVKQRERELEKLGFEHRQKVLTDNEHLRMREGDMKKQLEMELMVVK